MKHPEEVTRWNETGREVPARHTVVELLDDAAREYASLPATRTSSGVAYTHAELAASARSVAEQLSRLHVPRNTPVVVLLDHVPEAVVAVHAILRHGAFYVPIDHRSPLLRAARTFNLIGATHLVVTKKYRDFALRMIAEGDVNAVVYEITDTGELVSLVDTRPAVPANETVGQHLGDLAYAIFTSGSTGTPKAVSVTHRNVLNLVDWFNRRHDVGPHDILLQVSSFSFDLSAYDLLGVPAAGASLLLLPQSQLDDPEEIAETILTTGVTLWNSAPALFTAVSMFLELEDDTVSRSMRRVFLSGDWIPLSAPRVIGELFPNAALVALGGATEATVWSNDFVVGEVDPSWTSIPYGHPMQNARYYVLSEDGSPCALNEPGELFIAGACVTAGYLNDETLTSQRFLPDPWSTDGDRMYRTGDRARWTADGWVEFLGRLDNQVKIHGFRIELGEVEQHALRIPGVDEAVAVAAGKPRDPVLLLAYRSSAKLDPEAVREQLARWIPPYMVPSQITRYESLPVGGTGKVDRRALAETLS